MVELEKSYLLSIMFKKITRRNLDAFLEKHATGQKVLDIGAGGSSYGRFFPNRLTVDVDPMRKPDIVADAHSLPFKDEEFEYILCTEVLEHLKNPSKAVSEMKRVLKNDGVLILTTRFVYPIHDTPRDYWRFTKYGLRELFKDWNILELIPETQTFSTIGVLLQRISFQTGLRMGRFIKLKLFISAYIFDHMNFLIKQEYGDIKKEAKEREIMPSGYYLVCKKNSYGSSH